MPKKKYRRYSPEFKRHALKRASEDGVTDRSVCSMTRLNPQVRADAQGATTSDTVCKIRYRLSQLVLLTPSDFVAL
jgi:transposase-like protein